MLATGTVAELLAVTVEPLGAVPAVETVFVYEPPRSPAVTVCDAEQTIVAPGANVAGTLGVHVPSDASGSVMPTLVSVAVPVLVTVIEYVIKSPAAENEAVGEVFVIAILATGVVVLAAEVAVVPPGPVPDAVAVFVYEPARSPAVTVCVAGHEITPPGASEATGTAGVQVPSVAAASVTDTFVSGAVPVFVAVIV